MRGRVVFNSGKLYVFHAWGSEVTALVSQNYETPTRFVPGQVSFTTALETIFDIG